MFRCVSKLVALALVVLLPYSLMAADMQGAMLYATNSVAVNGATVTNTSAIFPGDKVSVADNGAATITLNGTSILVPKLTALTFNGNSVSLEPRAAVSVTTSAGMAAEIKNIKISPAKNGPAQYQVARYNGRVFVAAGLDLTVPSTRALEEFLVNLDCAAPVLVVTHDEPVISKSVSNLPYAEATEVAALSTEQVLRARSLVLTEKAFAALNEA